MWAIRSILLIFLVLCVVAFAYYNTASDQKVSVNLIWVNFIGVPLITVVFWSFVTGVLVSLFVFVSAFIRQSVQARSAHRRIRSLENEVTVLRNRPIEDSVDIISDAEKGRTGEMSAFTESE
ncbi:MAG: LapA family protein [candidate division Zixibacteria bacterium]|nr:LapA family protein [candidate division Zixibacteria bacterium]